MENETDVWDATSGRWVKKPDVMPAPPAPPPVGAVAGSVRGAAPAAAPVASGMQRMMAGAGQFTPQERAYWLENLPDITAGEENVATQNALSSSLRGQSAPTRGRMDWASQASRALSGFGSGLANKRAMEGQQALGRDIRFFAQNAPGSESRKRLERFGNLSLDDPAYG